MSAPIEWLIFDLGGVLIDVVPARTTITELARISDTSEARVASLLRERFTGPPFSPAECFQTGELDTSGFHEALNRGLEKPLSYETFITGLASRLRGEKPDMVALLQRLALRHRTACYSNTNPTHWHYIQRHFGFMGCFERTFASQILGFAKPDQRGFDAVVRTLEADPGTCLLIDDRQENVAGAHAAGWQALLFDGCASLEDKLQALGVDIGLSR